MSANALRLVQDALDKQRASSAYHWYMATLTKGHNIIESGWMLAESDQDLIEYARAMGYGIEIEHKGIANMNAMCPEVMH